MVASLKALSRIGRAETPEFQDKVLIPLFKSYGSGKEYSSIIRGEALIASGRLSQSNRNLLRLFKHPPAIPEESNFIKSKCQLLAYAKALCPVGGNVLSI